MIMRSVRWSSVLVLSLLAALASACGRDRDAAEAPEIPPAPATRPRSAPEVREGPSVVFLGDSLTAGYGLSPDEAYPALIEERLRKAGYPHHVVNAGVSGDTSAAALRRLERALRGDVDVLVIALGGNDGLRGLPPSELERNLQQMIDTARGRGIDVLLAGMEAPPNFGPGYTREFREVYTRLAEQDGVQLLPFLLDGVAGDAALNQDDGIHPNAEGQRRVAALIWPRLEPLLDAEATR